MWFTRSRAYLSIPGLLQFRSAVFQYLDGNSCRNSAELGNNAHPLVAAVMHSEPVTKLPF